MQKLNELSRWKTCESGDQIVLPSPKRRQVRLHVNAAGETRLFVKPEGKGDPIFLALVKGLDVVEFVANGTVTVAPDDRVNFYTAEGETVHFEESAHASFTKLITRKERNFELETLMARAEQNVSRRMETVLAQQEAMFEERLARAKADDQRTSATGDAQPSPEPKPDDGQQKPDQAKAAEGEGDGASDEPAAG